MYINIGNDTIIRSESIIGIFDLDNCTVTQKGRDFINDKRNKIVSVTNDLPKSFIICRENDEEIIYICQYQTSVLIKRL
ncbi:MAG: DUF370 domain-containing protein [Clostridia bacterium]|nr:DUF370 domain-containing protein [Clostridia bacterium]